MSGVAILSVSMALMGVGSTSSSVTTEQYTFTQGMQPMAKCRKVEATYHSGDGPVVTRGNKTITLVRSQDNRYTYETTTFCVEL